MISAWNLKEYRKETVSIHNAFKLIYSIDLIMMLLTEEEVIKLLELKISQDLFINT